MVKSIKRTLPKHCRGGKEKFRFLDLPGEIRNRIYEYYLDEDTIVELVPEYARYLIPQAHHGPGYHDPGYQGPGYYMPTKEKIVRCKRPLGEGLHVHGLKTKWESSIGGLHLVNKQIQRESLSHLYGRVVIFAQSTNRINNFIEVLPPSKLRWIRRLHLDHQSYGTNTGVYFAKWKEAHDKLWIRTVEAVVNNLVNLTKLTVNVDVRDVPFQLTLREAWVQPLLKFSKLKKLMDVRVGIFSKLLKEVYWPHDQASFDRFGAGEASQEINALVEMHSLFGQAIALMILGSPEKLAIQEYRIACTQRLKRTINHSQMQVGIFSMAQDFSWVRL